MIPAYNRSNSLKDTSTLPHHQALDAPLVQALTNHFSAIAELQQNILRYQWRGMEHGWNTLLAKQSRELELWQRTIREQFEQRGIHLPEAKPIDGPSIAAEANTLMPVDGLALAARMMTDMEALAWDLEGILAMAEQLQSTVVSDAVFGLNMFYHRSAGLYRQHLCTAPSLLEGWSSNL